MSDPLALALFCAAAGALCCLMVALAEALDAWDHRRRRRRRPCPRRGGEHMAKPKSPKPPTEAPADAEPQAEATHTSADGTVWVTTWWRWPRRSTRGTTAAGAAAGPAPEGR